MISPSILLGVALPARSPPLSAITWLVVAGYSFLPPHEGGNIEQNVHPFRLQSAKKKYSVSRAALMYAGVTRSSERRGAECPQKDVQGFRGFVIRRHSPPQVFPGPGRRHGKTSGAGSQYPPVHQVLASLVVYGTLHPTRPVALVSIVEIFC